MPSQEVKAQRPPDNPVTDQTTVRIMDGLRRLVRVLSTSARGATRQGEVSGAQSFVLRQIAAAPGLSIGQLADRTLSRQSTVSEVVARLAERGLIERGVSSVDARQSALTLTARGRKEVARIEPTAQEKLADGLATLPQEVRVALADGLESWLATADLDQVPATMFFEEEPKPHAKRRGQAASKPSRSSI